MNQTTRKPYMRVILLVLALFLAGLVGWKLGSEDMQDKWIDASQDILPSVIDGVIERYEEAPFITESTKELIKDEGVLAFIMGVWYEIDPGGVQDYVERYGL